MKTITLALRAEDAEPWLRQAAEEAARFGAWVDHLTKRTGNLPCRWDKLAEARKEWNDKFLRAKRTVEAFGVEYEPTSEPETLTITWHFKPSKKPKRIIEVPGIGKIGIGSGSAEFDYKRPYPLYRGGVHHDACRYAADRVVRRWRATLTEQAAA